MIPVDMGAVHAMGAQFKDNAFKAIAREAFRGADNMARQNTAAPAPTGIVSGSGNTNFRTTAKTPGVFNYRMPRLPAGTNIATPYRQGATPHSMVPSTRALPAGTPTKTPKALGTGFTGAPALPPGRMITTPYQQGATPHSMVPSTPALPPGKYRGIATPHQAPPRVIPMSGNAALTNRVNPNFSFSDTGGHDPLNRTQFNQPSTTPFSPPKVYTAAMTPPSAPSPKPSGQREAPVSGTQFSDVSTKDNSPYPTHVHPEGSSNAVLSRLSAAQSTPGRPNEFTVGSRNAQPGGIAAAGSRLEAWAQTKAKAVQARQASRRAGGRDKGLAQSASELENQSKAPLNRFAP